MGKAIPLAGLRNPKLVKRASRLMKDLDRELRLAMSNALKALAIANKELERALSNIEKLQDTKPKLTLVK